MDDFKNKIISEIKKIYDPEIPVNIYDLGLIYKIDIDEKKKITIEMTLTSPNCPVAESLPNQVKGKIKETEMALKGQTVSSSYKPAVLENGVKVLVPPFIENGDEILIDTRSVEYIKKV